MWSLEIRMADRALDRLRGQSSCVLARATIGERDTRVITAEDVVKQISTFGRYECLFKDRRQAQRFLDEIQNTLLALQEEQPGE